jgi:hypothetical protein
MLVVKGEVLPGVEVELLAVVALFYLLSDSLSNRKKANIA